VITGFRWSRGGAQARYSIVPTSPCSQDPRRRPSRRAVAGAKDILDQLDPGAAKLRAREDRTPGTFNANPLCAAAGVTALLLVEASDAARARRGGRGRAGTGLPPHPGRGRACHGRVGEASVFVIFPNPARRLSIRRTSIARARLQRLEGRARPQRTTGCACASRALASTLRRAGGFVSAAHGARELSQDAGRLSQRAARSEGGRQSMTRQSAASLRLDEPETASRPDPFSSW